MDILLVSFFNSGQTLEIVKAPLSLALKVSGLLKNAEKLVKAVYLWRSGMLLPLILNNQKQPSRGVPRKRFSENMQQLYERTAMSKCDFNNVALELH